MAFTVNYQGRNMGYDEAARMYQQLTGQAYGYKKGSLAGSMNLMKFFQGQADQAKMKAMFPTQAPGGVGKALGLTALPGRFGGGFGGVRGRGVMQNNNPTGGFQVARLSPTTGFRIDMGG